jgi:hypothetical protein
VKSTLSDGIPQAFLPLRFVDSQQPENCENRNDPDFVQAFLKKWCVESDFKASNLPLSLQLKCSGCQNDQVKRTLVKRSFLTCMEFV